MSKQFNFRLPRQGGTEIALMTERPRHRGQPSIFTGRVGYTNWYLIPIENPVRGGPTHALVASPPEAERGE
jgi:hypothetical protein